MVTQELLNAVMQEWVQEAVEIQRQSEALAIEEQGATPRGGLFRQRIRGLPLPSFMARGFRTASVS